MCYPDLVVVWVADSLPPLHRDGHDQEDAGREGEVAATLKEGENEVDEANMETKVKGQYKKIRDEKENISNTETGEESVEQVELCSKK